MELLIFFKIVLYALVLVRPFLGTHFFIWFAILKENRSNGFRERNFKNETEKNYRNYSSGSLCFFNDRLLR